jgi:hypothetical protein
VASMLRKRPDRPGPQVRAAEFAQPDGGSARPLTKKTTAPGYQADGCRSDVMGVANAERSTAPSQPGAFDQVKRCLTRRAAIRRSQQPVNGLKRRKPGIFRIDRRRHGGWQCPQGRLGSAQRATQLKRATEMGTVAKRLMGMEFPRNCSNELMTPTALSLR